MANIVLLHSPSEPRFSKIQSQCFNSGALEFLWNLYEAFDVKISQLYRNREQKNLELRGSVSFCFKQSPERQDKSWNIDPLPARLQNRHLDLGDVSASNSAHFIMALKSDVQAIQVDFDDGHSPTWQNQLLAYSNIYTAVHDTHKLPGAPHSITTCPVLIFRPRAWNIIEHNIMIDGKAVPGALVDFAIIMYHNALRLHQCNSGPYFYLSKLESASEAHLWNEIFVWAQKELGIPRGTIKACVLIENILSVFELDEILFALREHSMGLNCGMWDYCASIIAKLGARKTIILPDRLKYVSMEQSFLTGYIQVVVSTAHARGAPATGGMVAQMLIADQTDKNDNSKEIILKVLDAKKKEIDLGVDGFLVYDPLLVPFLNELWKKNTTTQNQIHIKTECRVTPMDLLAIPCGGVTLAGLEYNVGVTILFVYHWLNGKGHFFYGTNVEDSATAEISRWQVWQWVRFGVSIEDYSKKVSSLLVEKICAKFILDTHKLLCRSNAERKRFNAARYMSLEIFFARNPPEFITTHLNDNHKFRALSNKALLKGRL